MKEINIDNVYDFFYLSSKDNIIKNEEIKKQIYQALSNVLNTIIIVKEKLKDIELEIFNNVNSVKINDIIKEYKIHSFELEKQKLACNYSTNLFFFKFNTIEDLKKYKNRLINIDVIIYTSFEEKEKTTMINNYNINSNNTINNSTNIKGDNNMNKIIKKDNLLKKILKKILSIFIN